MPGPTQHLESIVVQGGYDVLEEDLGGESVSVVNDGLPVGPIPAVHLHTAAAPLQSPAYTHTHLCHCQVRSGVHASVPSRVG